MDQSPVWHQVIVFDEVLGIDPPNGKKQKAQTSHLELFDI